MLNGDCEPGRSVFGFQPELGCVIMRIVLRGARLVFLSGNWRICSMQQKTLLVWAVACALTIAACSSTPQTTLSPTRGRSFGLAALNPDGSSLKVDAPTDLGPNGVTVIDTRPTLTFNATLVDMPPVAFAYEVEVQNEAGNVIYTRIVGPATGAINHTVEVDLPSSTNVWFRGRARAGEQSGPWSGYAQFRTDGQASGGPCGPGGPVGPPRNIDVGEAVAIIRAIYDAGRCDLGGRSSRDTRNLYLEIAVAALHYGHGVWNQAGPDSNWCIKNGGPGRPQADDVIARCNTRDAWDLILSIGADHWSWHPDYIGRLPGEQAIYAPNPGTLGLAPQPR